MTSVRSRSLTITCAVTPTGAAQELSGGASEPGAQGTGKSPVCARAAVCQPGSGYAVQAEGRPDWAIAQRVAGAGVDQFLCHDFSVMPSVDGLDGLAGRLDSRVTRWARKFHPAWGGWTA